SPVAGLVVAIGTSHAPFGLLCGYPAGPASTPALMGRGGADVDLVTVVADAPVRTRPGRLGHVPGLDGLRGAAVLAVTLFHFPTARFVPGGWVGVDVFFVLSGFLITALLLERRGEPLRAFYRRRLRRLGPAAAAFVACWAVLAL